MIIIVLYLSFSVDYLIGFYWIIYNGEFLGIGIDFGLVGEVKDDDFLFVRVIF